MKEQAKTIDKTMNNATGDHFKHNGPHSKGNLFNKTTMKKGPNHRQNNEEEANARNKTMKKQPKTIDITMKSQAKHHRENNEQPSQNHRQNNETQAKPIAKQLSNKTKL